MLRCLLLLFCLSEISVHAQVNQDTTLENRISGYQKIITSLWLNRPDSAIHYARKAMKLTESSEDLKSKAVAVRLLGGVHLYMGDYDSALLCSQKAMQLSVQTGDSVLISSAFNNIGFTEYHFGNYTRALENLLRSMAMKKGIHNNYGLAQTINNVGLVYLKLKDFEKAKSYFNEALQTATQFGDKNQVLYACNNLGFACLQAGDYATAEAWFRQSLDHSSSVNNNNWVATTYSGLGQTKLKMNKMSEAIDWLKQSLQLRKDIGELTGISEIYYLLSQTDAAMGRYDSALYKLRYSQSIAQQIGSRNRQLENYDWLRSLFLQRSEMDSAFHYQGLYIKLKDSLFNENMARDLAAIQLQRAEQENLEKISERDMQLLRRSNWIALLALALIFSFILAIIYYQSYKGKKRLSNTLIQKNEEIVNKNEEILQQQESLLLNNQKLVSAKDQIDTQNELLRELNKKLQATVDLRTRELEIVNNDLKISNFELDHFMYRSSHDLKGPLVRLLGVCLVAQMDVDDVKAKKYFQLIEDTSRHLNELFDRLKAVSDINNADTNKVQPPIDFRLLLDKIKNHLGKTDSYTNIQFQEKIEDGLSFCANELLVETVLHRLLENAIKFQKHTDDGDKFVKIKIRKNKNDLVITISDNGIGIDESFAPYIFDMFTLAARHQRKIGLGLYMVKQAVDKMRGRINHDKTKSNFTRFKVYLPFQQHGD